MKKVTKQKSTTLLCDVYNNITIGGFIAYIALPDSISMDFGCLWFEAVEQTRKFSLFLAKWVRWLETKPLILGGTKRTKKHKNKLSYFIESFTI